MRGTGLWVWGYRIVCGGTMCEGYRIVCGGYRIVCVGLIVCTLPRELCNI